jgi:hypothetical protein
MLHSSNYMVFSTNQFQINDVLLCYYYLITDTGVMVAWLYTEFTKSKLHTIMHQSLLQRIQFECSDKAYFLSTNYFFFVTYFIIILLSATVRSPGMFLTNFMKQRKNKLNLSFREIY